MSATKPRRLYAWVLGAGLLFAQVAALAHAFEHPALEPANSHCLFWAHGFGLDHSPVTSPPEIVVSVAQDPVQAAVFVAVHPRQRPPFRSRAPPLII